MPGVGVRRGPLVPPWWSAFESVVPYRVTWAAHDNLTRMKIEKMANMDRGDQEHCRQHEDL